MHGQLSSQIWRSEMERDKTFKVQDEFLRRTKKKILESNIPTLQEDSLGQLRKRTPKNEDVL